MAVEFKGIEGRSREQLAQEIQRGGKFVFYQYVYSVLIMSFKRPSPIYYIPPGESVIVKGLPWSLLTACVGWLGFPWGFIWTPMTIFKNFMGGTDVTKEAMSDLGIDLTAASYMAPSPGPAPSPTPVAAPANPGYIQFLSGPLAGQNVAVPAAGMYIGQAAAPGALTVNDPMVAPQHCWIGPDNTGAVVLVDMGAPTGTWVVNATSSTRVQQVALQPGDQVYLGGQGGPVFQYFR